MMAENRNNRSGKSAHKPEHFAEKSALQARRKPEHYAEKSSSQARRKPEHYAEKSASQARKKPEHYAEKSSAPQRSRSSSAVSNTAARSSDRSSGVRKSGSGSAAVNASRSAASPQRKTASAVPQKKAVPQAVQAKAGAAVPRKKADGEVAQKKSSAGSAKKTEAAKASNVSKASEQDERLLNHKKKILNQMRKREQSLASFNISVIIAVFAFITLFLTFGARSTVSVEEKRELAKMPEFTWESYFDGSFTEDFAHFYNDTVPMRSSFMSFISSFRGKMGLKFGDDGAQLVGGKPTLDQPTQSSKPTESKVPNTANVGNSSSNSSTSSSGGTSAPVESTSAEQPDPPKVDGELSGSVLVLESGWGISLFGGGYATGQNYANTLNKIKQAVGDDVNVYSMVAPTSGSFYLPAKYKGWMASEPDNINNINKYLNGVIPVDAYGALSKHTDEAIYARTDHHWNQLGAYYSAEEFAKTAGVYFAPLSDYDSYSLDDHMGTMLAYSNYHKAIANNPETFTYFIPKNKYSSTMYGEYLNNPQASFVFYPTNLISANDFNGCKDYYGVFFGGADSKAFRVKTDVENGRKLIIVKDSYGNAVAPCLTNSFEEIWLVDMRFLKKSVVQLAKEEGITDILFCMNTFSATGPNQQTLANIQLPIINDWTVSSGSDE